MARHCITVPHQHHPLAIVQLLTPTSCKGSRVSPVRDWRYVAPPPPTPFIQVVVFPAQRNLPSHFPYTISCARVENKEEIARGNLSFFKVYTCIYYLLCVPCNLLGSSVCFVNVFTTWNSYRDLASSQISSYVMAVLGIYNVVQGKLCCRISNCQGLVCPKYDTN